MVAIGIAMKGANMPIIQKAESVSGRTLNEITLQRHLNT